MDLDKNANGFAKTFFKGLPGVRLLQNTKQQQQKIFTKRQKYKTIVKVL